MKDFILVQPWARVWVSVHWLERDFEDSSQNGDVLSAQNVPHFREDDHDDDAHARDGVPKNAPPDFHGNPPPCACRYDVPHSCHFDESASPAFGGARGAEPTPMSLNQMMMSWSYLMKMMMSQSLKKSLMTNWMKKTQMSLNQKKKSLKTPPP